MAFLNHYANVAVTILEGRSGQCLHAATWTLSHGHKTRFGSEVSNRICINKGWQISWTGTVRDELSLDEKFLRKFVKSKNRWISSIH